MSTSAVASLRGLRQTRKQSAHASETATLLKCTSEEPAAKSEKRKFVGDKPEVDTSFVDHVLVEGVDVLQFHDLKAGQVFGTNVTLQ